MCKKSGLLSVVSCLLLFAFILNPYIAFASDPSTAKGAHTSSGSSTPSHYWYLADGYTAKDVYIAVRNCEGSTAYVTFYFYDKYGYITYHDIYIPANGAASVYVNSIFYGSPNPYCTHIESTKKITAERSMYGGYEGSCGSGSAVYLASGDWCFGDVYADSTSTSYINLMNVSGIGTNYTLWKHEEGNTTYRNSYCGAHSRLTWTISSSLPKNYFVTVYGNEGFTVEKSWEQGTKYSSSGGSHKSGYHREYFAEGYSGFPSTYITGGWTGNVDYMWECLAYRWDTNMYYSDPVYIDVDDAESRAVTGVPGSKNYCTEVQQVFDDSPSSFRSDADRTTLANNNMWATSSEGRDEYDRPGVSRFYFAECYTGHDVYLNFGNYTGATARFGIIARDSAGTLYSVPIINVNCSRSIRMNDYLPPGAKNYTLYVYEINNLWPVSVERTSYFN
jgi:hypothetical protein